MPASTIPVVPLRTPFYEGDHLSRTWIIFFESLGILQLHRTLLVKDSTVGDDIADHVPIYVSGYAQRIIGVLRKPITSDLIVRCNVAGVDFATITIPAATMIDTPIILDRFNTQSAEVTELDVITWDILASDGSKDANGIASFTLQWSASRGTISKR